MALAHSANDVGQKHDLRAHLEAVAKLASKFASAFGAADLGYWVGLWHDLGKFHPAFQSYLENPVTPRGPDHKGAGAVLASECAGPLAFLIAGHHGGLQDKATLKAWLSEKANDPNVKEAIALARAELPSLKPKCPPSFPSWSRLDIEFFLRMLFSALTDA